MVQAVELPAGNESGMANPFVAVRFGGKAKVSDVKQNTTCPVLYVQPVLPVHLFNDV